MSARQNCGMATVPTSFTELVGCRRPLQLAPMGGGVCGPELAVAVCNAGGLGMISAAHLAPLAEQIRVVDEGTRAPYGVGFFAWDLPARTADLEFAIGQARVIDMFWGPPDPTIVGRIHTGGALALWQVGSRDEALAAADAGCDAVVVQGVEAGGHVRGTTPLARLLDEVVPVVTVPIVAAGGIATATDVRRVFDAGASAVRVGTRLLATRESAAHPDYLAALVAASGADTELTTAFSGGWEDAPHRVLRAAIAAAEAAPDPVAEAAFGESRAPIPRWSAMPPSRDCDGQVTAMAMYAGMGVDAVTDIRPAADVVDELMSGDLGRDA
jgi:nitronate monooxygenase